jgi:hypothetical protein
VRSPIHPYLTAHLTPGQFSRYSLDALVPRTRTSSLDGDGWWADTAEVSLADSPEPLLLKTYTGPHRHAAWLRDARALQGL